MESTLSGPEHTTSVILDIILPVYMAQEEESAVHQESGIGIGTPCGVKKVMNDILSQFPHFKFF